MKEINFEQISFSIIAFAGDAKSTSLAALKKAKNKNFKEAEKMMLEAEKMIIEAEKQHMDVISLEAQGEKIISPVLFIHAEDQLLTTQTLMLIIEEFIDLYKNFN